MSRWRPLAIVLLSLAASAQIGDATMAVAVIGDVIYGADTGAGFQIQAARVPSLGQVGG